MTKPRRPGRPPLGKGPMSPSERQQHSRGRRRDDGGSTLSLTLDATETEALASGMAKSGHTVKRTYLASLILKHR